MPDREQIIKGMKTCISQYECSPDNCPYYITTESGLCWDRLMTDALALLKEQETANLYKCPNCGTWVSAENVVRCKDCKYGYCINPSCDEKEKIYECMKYPIANLRITHEPDWFCGDGKHKEGQ